MFPEDSDPPCTGYETFSCEQDSGDEDDEDEEDEEDDSEEAPQAVKLEQQPSRAANGRADGMVSGLSRPSEPTLGTHM
eukprot:1158965-Pelagomonas_calceolata.AAC.4